MEPVHDPSNVTRILRDLEAGVPEAADRLFELVYLELRSLARRHLRDAGEARTMQPTALVHEVFLRLFDNKEDLDFRDRQHFFAVVARAMRHAMVDQARRRAAQKRGGAWKRVTMSGFPEAPDSAIDIMDLEDALTKLGAAHERPSRVAELRLFAGLDVQEVAAALSLTARQVRMDWTFARSWLRRQMGGVSGP